MTRFFETESFFYAKLILVLFVAYICKTLFINIMTETIDLTEPISQLGIIDNDENDEFLDHLFGKQKVS